MFEDLNQEPNDQPIDFRMEAVFMGAVIGRRFSGVAPTKTCYSYTMITEIRAQLDLLSR